MYAIQNQMQEIVSKKNIGERLRKLRLERDLSQAEISETLGLSRSHYSQLELGKQFPSYTVLSKVAEFYCKDYEWILHGSDLKAVISNVKSVLDDELKGTPSIPLKALATSPPDGAELRNPQKNVVITVSEQLTYLENRADPAYTETLPDFFFPVPQLPAGNHRAFEVQDDSMDGVLCSHDFVVATAVENFKRISRSTIYVVVLDEHISTRRLMDYDRKSGAFSFVPDNKRYKTEWIKLDDIRELWEVNAKVSCCLNKTIQNITQYFNDFEATVNELRDEVFKIKADLA